MSSPGRLGLDVVIFGGGAAGLWLLDLLHRDGFQVLLLEASDLGAGQTVASQGIIHGGLKYTLGGMLTPSARAIREMPVIWRECLDGARTPDLGRTRLRAAFCHLWRTESLSSRFAMVGARAGLRIAPTPLEAAARPGVLRACPGLVARIDEQVIEPDTFIADLARQGTDRILKVDIVDGLALETRGPGHIELIKLRDPSRQLALDLEPRAVVFAAGAGNAALRTRAGLSAAQAQLRPLHMVLIRGDLPELNGHCVDGLSTRATITTTRDSADRTVWQVGGRIAEEGTALEAPALIQHARRELESILPGQSFAGLEWSTYRADRAEAATRSGRRPTHAQVVHEGNTLTVWPTKLALAPQGAAEVRSRLAAPTALEPLDPAPDDMLRKWPRPAVAKPPWEEPRQWSVEE